MTSKWSLLANATLKFVQQTAVAADSVTGNEIPSAYTTYTTRAYFKKADQVTDIGKGVPVGAYPVKGYTVDPLPAWCKDPTYKQIECTVDHLGSGYFSHIGKISVVRDRVEAIGQGTPIQGYFILQGGF